MTDDPNRRSLVALFRAEADAQTRALTAGLLALERQDATPERLEACMRAAHSLKGAARIVGLDGAVRLAHAMEDCFVAAQRGRAPLGPARIDALLRSLDLLNRLAARASDDADGAAASDETSRVDACVAALSASASGEAAAEPPLAIAPEHTSAPARAHDEPIDASGTPDRAIPVTAETLNRLLALAGEALVGSRRLAPFGSSLQQLGRRHASAAAALDRLRAIIGTEKGDARASVAIVERTIAECRQALADRVRDFDGFERRLTNLSQRLYDEARACRMRPFADGIQGVPRAVRDLARALGKDVTLEIAGERTPVDRDILRALEAPISHLLRNAVDHGIETPAERRAAGKPERGVVRLEARHRAGLLHIVVADDGRGVDRERLRAAIVGNRLAAPDAVAAMHDWELLAFLFLPGFTLSDAVTEISGRGVGLDVVRDMVTRVRGRVDITSEAGRGTTFHLHLPVTLSVVRALLAEIAGEIYAMPLVSVVRVLNVTRETIAFTEGRPHVVVDGQLVGLVSAREVLDLDRAAVAGDAVSIIVIGDSAAHRCGLVVDRFIGEQELAVQPLDAHLGKIKDIAAAALLDDGSPVLILDPDDLRRSIDKIAAAGPIAPLARSAGTAPARRKRVLVVEDSLTVRELERKLLAGRGYAVDVAVDGMDGWNAARTGRFDLVVTDIDMPRLDGIELVTLMSKDARLRSVPVMIVSYKDREEDRRRGLDAGAARYLTKSSFHDESLVQAVVDLIGEPGA